MKPTTRNIVLQDFSKFIKKAEDRTYSKLTGKKLISFSSLTKYLSQLNLENIPRHILENARVFGKNVMEHFEELYRNKINDLTKYEFFSESEKACVIDILRKIEDQHCKIVTVETLITNDKFYGYVDFILKRRGGNQRYKIVELKTSTSNELKFRHKLQLAIYAGILLENDFVWFQNKPWIDLEVWIYNTKTCELTTHRVDFKEIRRITNELNKILELFDLSDYKFKWMEK